MVNIFACKLNVLQKITKKVIQDLVFGDKIKLDSTQKKLCIPIVDRIYKKMVVGIKFSAIKIDGNMICDGHHRYLASILANCPIERIPSIQTSATVIVN